MNLITIQTMASVDRAIDLSRAVIPNDQLLPMFNAAVGRLNIAMLRELMSTIREEGVAVAALAIRIATEGDTSFNDIRDLAGIGGVSNSNLWVNKLVIPLQEGGFPIVANIPYAGDNHYAKLFYSLDKFTEFVAEAIRLGAVIDDKSCNDHITKAIRDAQRLVENETATGDK